VLHRATQKGPRCGQAAGSVSHQKHWGKQKRNWTRPRKDGMGSMKLTGSPSGDGKVQGTEGKETGGHENSTTAPKKKHQRSKGGRWMVLDFRRPTENGRRMERLSLHHCEKKNLKGHDTKEPGGGEHILQNHARLKRKKSKIGGESSPTFFYLTGGDAKTSM